MLVEAIMETKLQAGLIGQTRHEAAFWAKWEISTVHGEEYRLHPLPWPVEQREPSRKSMKAEHNFQHDKIL